MSNRAIRLFVVVAVLTGLFVYTPEQPTYAVSTCDLIQPAKNAGFDAYLKQDHPDEERGDDSELRVRTELGKLNRSVIRFDLSGIPANAIVDSATLGLFVKDVKDSDVTINAHEITTPWNEATVTWVTPWTTPGGDFSPAVLDSTAFTEGVKDYYATWDLTAAAGNWLQNPGSNYGVLLEAPVSNPRNETKFASNDESNPDERPYLEVCYSPGISLEPNNIGTGEAGVESIYAHILAVGSLTDEIVDLSASSSLGWTVTVYEDENENGLWDPGDDAINQAPPLGPDETFHLLVGVMVPATAANGQIDITTVTATGQNSGLSSSATDTTRVGLPAYAEPVVDGVVDPAYYLSPYSDYQDYCDAGGNVLATVFSTIDLNDPNWETVYIVLQMRRVLVDNSYGDNIHPSWTAAGKSHSLGNMDGSDKAQFNLYDANGTLLYDPIMDYVEPDQPTPSGWGSAGITGGDSDEGGLNPAFFQGETSLGFSLNAYCTSSSSCMVNGVDLFQDSPPIDVYYSPTDPFFNNWEFTYQYEIGVDKDAFGAAGFGDVTIPYTHVSPNKIGSNEIPVTPCAGSIGDRVWYDANADGVQDPGEDGINGVQLVLYRDNGDGILDPATDIPVGTQITSGDGDYDFTGLGPGTYFVDVVDDSVPDGYQITTNNDPTAPIALALGQDYNDADFGYVLLNNICVPSLNFFTEPTGASIDPGTFLAEQYAAWGVHITSSDPLAHPPIVFDSSNPSGEDFDLGSPNEDFGGPGIGNGGGIGGLAPNTVPLGHLMIIAEDIVDADGDGLVDDPDDNQGGGTMILTFDHPTEVRGFDIIDIETTEVATASTFDAGGAPIGTHVVSPTGNNGVRHQVVGDFGVRRLEIDLSSTGGVTNIELCIPAEPSAAIGNYVWIDENEDGTQDAGEPGLGNVTVELYDAAGNLVATTTTDTDGGYLFPNLAPGTYTIQVEATTLPDGLYQTTNPVLPGADFGNQSQPYTVSVGPAEENLTADFGYNWGNADGNTGLGAIGDYVWIDADGDGAQDGGEPGIGGVIVTIYFDSNGDGLVEPGVDTPYTGAVDQNGNTGTGTTTTNPDGSYIFHDLPAGQYVVVVEPPPGYAQTGDPDDFGLPATDPDNQTTTPIVLGPGDVFLNADFGYQPTAAAEADNTLGDTVWFDADADGVQDPGEPGIPGVTLALYDAGGAIIATATTDADGEYLFTGLPDGTYTIAVNDTDNVLAGLAQSGDPDGVFDNQSTVVDLGVGDPNPAADLDQDFGYTPAGHQNGDGLIGDTIWFDTDGDGLEDPGEPGIEGVTLQLYDAGGNLVATTVTDENGLYAFGGLDPAATYTVVVAPDNFAPGGALEGLTNTGDPEGDNDGESTSDLSVDGPIDLTRDFGYVATGPDAGTLGNLVWLDSNADGFWDGADGPDGLPGNDDDEPLLAGVTLDLYRDLNGNGQVDPGEPLIGGATTSAIPFAIGGDTGNYAFTGLPLVGNGDGDAPAEFVVDVTDDAGLLTGYWHSLGAPGLSNHSQTDPYAAELSAASPTNVTADFGYYVEPAALGNRAWLDSNGNGLQDPGEPGLADVDITLVIGYPNGSFVTLATATDATGFYQFGNLLLDEDYNGDGVGPEPTFVIAAGTPAGYARTLIEQGSDTTVDSNDHDGTQAFAIQGQTDTSFANDGAAIASYDFGYFQVLNLGDFVWYDRNGNGAQDAGESGIAGVLLNLYADFDGDGFFTPGVDAFVASQVTGPNGEYGFANLRPGDYLVEIPATNFDGPLANLYNTIGFSDPDDDVDADDNGTDGAGQEVSDYGVNVYSSAISLTSQGEPVTDGDGANGNLTLDLGFFGMDLGDLPDTAPGNGPGNYNTLLEDDGAAHIVDASVSGRIFLGDLIDIEIDGQPGLDATGDGADEDGVLREMGSVWGPGLQPLLDVTVTGGTGRLVGWIDWNNDGVMDAGSEAYDFGELAPGFHSVPLPSPIPFEYIQGNSLYVRFRLFDPTQLPGGNILDAFTGRVSNGEVEDYFWEFDPTVVALQQAGTISGSSLPLAASAAGFGLLAALTVVVLRRRRDAR